MCQLNNGKEPFKFHMVSFSVILLFFLGLDLLPFRLMGILSGSYLNMNELNIELNL